MKYFSPQLYDGRIYSQEQIDKEFAESYRLYSLEFEKSKKKLPVKLLRLIDSGYFHDAEIRNINMGTRDKRDSKLVDTEVVFSHCGFIAKFMYSDMLSIDISCRYPPRLYSGCYYLYGELLRDEKNKCWTHNFMTTEGEMRFAFKKMKLVCEWDTKHICKIGNRPWG